MGCKADVHDNDNSVHRPENEWSASGESSEISEGQHLQSGLISIDISDRKGKRGKMNEKKVTFDKVEIRKFPIILGDHPDCKNGPPITIDWIPFASKHIGIEKFESKRTVRRRSSENDLLTSADSRRRLLRQQGEVTGDEIKQVMCENYHIRRQREESFLHLNSSKRQSTLTRQKIKSVLNFGGSKKSLHPSKTRDTPQKMGSNLPQQKDEIGMTRNPLRIITNLQKRSSATSYAIDETKRSTEARKPTRSSSFDENKLRKGFTASTA